MTDQELYDRATREDAYNEGVKASLALIFLAYSKELRVVIRSEIIGLGVDNMRELTSAELNVLIGRIKKRQNAIFAKYGRELTKELEKYAAVTGRVTNQVFQVSTDIKLWAKVQNSPIPANGVYLDNFLTSFERTSKAEIENAVRKAWANGESVQNTIAQIASKSTKQGTASTVQMLERRAEAVVETVGHHVFTTSAASVLADAFGQYVWVSVMDSRTSEICKERNGRVYTFGLGPVPPAHIRCRSHIAPTVFGNVKKESLQEWLNRQPASLQKELRDYINKKPLSVSEFESKVDKITL